MGGLEDPQGVFSGASHAVYTDQSEYATRTIGGLLIAVKTGEICPIGKISQAGENPAEH